MRLKHFCQLILTTAAFLTVMGCNSAPYSVSGQVLDQDGWPVSGVGIFIDGSAQAAVTSDDYGQWAVSGLTGETVIRAYQGEKLLSPCWVVTRQAQGINFAAHTGKPYSLSGRIITKDGQPLEGIIVKAHAATTFEPPEGASLISVYGPETLTDSNGAYSMDGIAGPVDIWPESPGWRYGPRSRHVSEESTGIDFLVSSYYLSGKIVDAGGNPLSQTVRLNFGGAYPSTWTNSNGTTWYLAGIWGPITITPVLQGFTFEPASVTVTPTLRGFEFEPASATVTGPLSIDFVARAVAAAALQNVQSIAAGSSHSLALHTDGKLSAWGKNTYGQLGDGTYDDHPRPITVIQGGVVQAEAGENHCLIIKNDGKVWAWGNNISGQLGDGTTLSSAVPKAVANISGAVKVSAGYHHSLALLQDGTVWAWGANSLGQLGDGTNEDSHVPVCVSGLTNIVDIAAGLDYSLAVGHDGTIWAWGTNLKGAVNPSSTTACYLRPSMVLQASGVVSVAAGREHALAGFNTGKVIAWGGNNSGELGAPGGTTGLIHSQIPEPVAMVSAGHYFSLALGASGKVYAWGSNSSGQLGLPDSIWRVSVPTEVPGISGGASIVAGAIHSLVVVNDGTIWAWGYVIDRERYSPIQIVHNHPG